MKQPSLWICLEIKFFFAWLNLDMLCPFSKQINWSQLTESPRMFPLLFIFFTFCKKLSSKICLLNEAKQAMIAIAKYYNQVT